MSDRSDASGRPRRRAAGGRGAAGRPAGDREALAYEIKVALLMQALEDPEYRQLALRDPQAALRRNRFIGAAQRVPPRLRFRVVEETPERLYLVIPARPDVSALAAKNPKDILLRKALSDPTYLDRLVADPRSVLGAEFLVEVPPGFEVTVLRETAQERIAVLPADLRAKNLERVPDDLLQYQSSVWGGGGGGGCDRTFLGSLIENLCRHASESPDPFCTTDWEPECQPGQPGDVRPI
jgi:hypothetical protein